MATIPGFSDATFLDRALYLENSRALILADLHIGRGRRQGLEVPLSSVVAIPERLDALLSRLSPDHVVFAGDILDAFDRVPPGVAERISKLLSLLESAGVSVHLVPGNHDQRLEHLVEHELHESVCIDGTLITHGHLEIETEARRYVLGHLHPALRIEGVKRPCYLIGPIEPDAQVCILPAFTRLAPGTVINRRFSVGSRLPLLAEATLAEYRPVVYDAAEETTLTFPALETLRDFL